jgi:hypothetical protein
MLFRTMQKVAVSKLSYPTRILGAMVQVLESFDNAKFLPVEKIYVRWFCILLLLRQGPELLQSIFSRFCREQDARKR